jgi:hypothetical protein
MEGSTDGIKLTGRAVIDPGPGHVDMSRYPNLAYTPEKGVFSHLSGAPVDQVALEAQNLNVVATLDAVAERLGTSFGEVLDALRYARDRGAI